MARGSPSDRKRQRALDELAAFDKAIRRGQRPAPLTVVDSYLELPVGDRTAYFELVQRLVGKALDDLQVRPPAPPALVSWCQRLEAAPELVKGHDEPNETAFERWWTLMRTALGRRNFAMAERIWVHLAPATRERAPVFARLIEEWFEQPAGPSDAMLTRLRGPLDAFIAKAQANAAEPDPRLGVEPVSGPRESLRAEASRDEVRAGVETVFAQKAAVMPRLRGVLRALPRDRQAWLWAEAAPFLLREALARDQVELLSGLAEALSNTTEPLAAELEVALRWSFTISAKHPSVFPRFALLGLARDPSSFDRITSALFALGIDHQRFTAELSSLLTALLRHQKPTAKLWSWAVALVPPGSDVDHDELKKELLAALPALVETPPRFAETLSRMDAEDSALTIDFIATFVEPSMLERFVRALWPLANDQMRRNLAEAFDALVERYDQLARPKPRSSRASIPYSLEVKLQEMMDLGDSPEAAVEELLEELPPPVADLMRKALLELARQGPPPPSAASRALWAEFGKEIVAATPGRLDDGFFYVEVPSARLSLIEAAFAEHKSPEAWVGKGHRIDSLVQDAEAINRFLDLVAHRFGDTVATWRAAHRTQDRCRCLFSLAVAIRLLIASIKEGLADARLVRELRAIFPYSYAQERIDHILRVYKPRPKRRTSPKPEAGEKAKPVAGNAKKPAAKKSPAAKAETVKPAAKKSAAAKAEKVKPSARESAAEKAGTGEKKKTRPAVTKAEKKTQPDAKKDEKKTKPTAERAAKTKKPTAKEIAQRTAELRQVIRDLFDTD